MASPVLLTPRTLLPLIANASARKLLLLVLFIFVFWVVFMASKDHTEVRMVSYYIISQGGSERLHSNATLKIQEVNVKKHVTLARQCKKDLCSLFPCTMCVHRWVLLLQWQADLCLFLLLGFAIGLKIISSYACRGCNPYFSTFGCNPTIPVSILSLRHGGIAVFFRVHWGLLRFPLSAVYFIWFPISPLLIIFICLLFSTQTRLRVWCKWLLIRLHLFAFLMLCLTSFLLYFPLAALP